MFFDLFFWIRHLSGELQCRNFRTRYVDFARDISNRTNDSVKCYGISCASNFKICRKMNITSFPTVILFAKSATTYTQKINYWQLNLTAVLKILEVDIQQTPVTRKSVLQESRNGREIVDNLKGFDGSLWLRKNPKMVPTGGIQKSSNRHNSKDLIVNDIHLSFDFHLRNEIFTSEDSPLDEHSKEVLREWLILLQKTTPTFWHLQTLIKHMLHEFDSVISSEAMLLNLLDQYPNPSMGHDADWSEGCSHGQKGNGFTCGIWLLYHVMTIGLVEYNDNVATNGSDLISTVGAAETLKLYINTFFRCEDCRYHFTKDYDNCSFDRCQRLRSDDFSLLQSIELSIWLVETHNGVAKRLLDESSEPISDQEKLSKEWPDRRVCPHCWDSEGVLNHINTFDFLKSEYW